MRKRTLVALIGAVSGLAAASAACSAIVGINDPNLVASLDDGGGNDVSAPEDGGADRAVPVDAPMEDVASADVHADVAPACGGNMQSCCNGSTCTAPLMCSGGVCGCGAGKSLCNGQCIDTQMDNANCGGCGLACPSGCTAGECIVTLATNIPNAWGITLNGLNAYVTQNAQPGGIYAVQLSSGQKTLLASGQARPDGIAVDNAFVYWANNNDGTVMKLSLGGGAPVALASGQTTPSALALDPTNSFLYWTNDGNPGAVMRVNLSTSAVSTVIGGINNAYGVAVDANFVYVAAESDDYIFKVLPTGGGVVQITKLQNNPFALAIDQNNVYFTNAASGGDARQAAKTDTMVDGTVLGKVVGIPGGIASDGTHVYFTGDNTLFRATVGQANSAKAVAMNQSGASFVAVDAQSVYWTNYTAGTVMKMTPK